MQRDHHSTLRRVTRGRIGLAIALATVFLFALLLNLSTPMLADDYSLAFIAGSEERVTSLGDIFESQRQFYRSWSGRSVTLFIAQLFIFVGQPVASVVNAAGFALLVLLIYLNARGLKSARPSLLIGISLLLWFSVPAFGQTVLWLTGSAVYLWGSVLALAALLPFRLHLTAEDSSPDNAITLLGAACLGLLAGWTNENMAPAMVIAMIAFMALFRKYGRGIPAWSVALLGSAVVGSLFLLLAPGNFARMNQLQGHSPGDGGSLDLLGSLLTVTHALFLNNVFALLMLLAVVWILLSAYGDSSSALSRVVAGVFLAAALIATFVMVLSPQFPERAWFGVIILTVVAAATLYSSLDPGHLLISRLTMVVLLMGGLLFATQFSYSYLRDIRVTHAEWEARVQHISEEKAAGRLHVVVDPITALGRHNAAHNLADLDEDPDEWPNYDIARYYSLKSISAKAQGQ